MFINLARLESILSKFTTLTKGTTIYVEMKNGDRFGLFVQDLKPEDSVAITDVDINTDFAPLEDEKQEQAPPTLDSQQEGSISSGKNASYFTYQHLI